MKISKLAIGAVAAAALVPAAASAQSYSYPYWGGVYSFSEEGPYGYDRGYRSDALMERTERVRDWIRRGSDEGWLRGWQARRAWQELGSVRQLADSGYDRGQAWQRLNRLQDFLRDAKRDAY